MTLDLLMTTDPQDEEGRRTSSDQTVLHQDDDYNQRTTMTENEVAYDDDDDMTEINVDDVDMANGEIVSRLERRRLGMSEMWTPVSIFSDGENVYYNYIYSIIHVDTLIRLRILPSIFQMLLFIEGGRTRIRTKKKGTVASRVDSYSKNKLLSFRFHLYSSSRLDAVGHSDRYATQWFL